MGKKSRFIPSAEEQTRLRALGRQINQLEGITGQSSVTATQLRARMVRKGLNPEDRLFNRELMRMRYGSEEEK